MPNCCFQTIFDNIKSSNSTTPSKDPGQISAALPHEAEGLVGDHRASCEKQTNEQVGWPASLPVRCVLTGLTYVTDTDPQARKKKTWDKYIANTECFCLALLEPNSAPQHVRE